MRMEALFRLRNPCHLKEKHPWRSCCGFLEEKTRRSWLRSLLLLLVQLAVGGSIAPAPPRLFPANSKEAVAVVQGKYSGTGTYAHTHTHTRTCQFPLLPCSLSGKKGKAFLSSLIPPMTGTFSFLHFWLKSRCCSGSVLHFPPGLVSKCCTTLDVNFSWRTSTWRSQGTMRTLHLPNKLLHLHFAINPSVLLAMKHWSLLLPFPTGSQF